MLKNNTNNRCLNIKKKKMMTIIIQIPKIIKIIPVKIRHTDQNSKVKIHLNILNNNNNNNKKGEG